MTCPAVLPTTWISVVERDEIIRKPADTLKTGDAILGANGTISKFSGEVTSGAGSSLTTFYGINDEVPFFSSCQPLWTNGGWKAVQPEMTKKTHPWLTVGRLTVGDYVFKLCPEITSPEVVKYDRTIITKFTTHSLSSDKLQLSFQSDEGAKTFHGNGLLMSNNHPEATTKGMTKNVKSLPIEEKKELTKVLRGDRELVEKLFGSNTVKCLESGLRSTETTKKSERTTIPVDRFSHLNLFDFILTDLNSIYRKKSPSGYKLPTLSLSNGHVFLDEKPAAYSYIEREMLYWKRLIGEDTEEHGCLKLNGEGLSGRGVISLTPETADERDKDNTIIVGAATTMKYSCKVSPNNPPFPYRFQLGYEITPRGESRSVNKVLCVDTDEEVKGSQLVCSFAAEHLSVTLSFGTLASFCPYKEGRFCFTFGYDDFEGVVYEYDPQSISNLGAEHKLCGTQLPSEMGKTVMAAANAITHPWHSEIGSFKPETSIRDYLHIAMSLPSSSQLNVDELLTFPPPNDVSFNELSQTKLFNWMKYQMNEEWLGEILGLSKPMISDADKAVIDQPGVKQFLVIMSQAYLLDGLQGVDELADQWIEKDLNKVLYYWAGPGITSISRNAHFISLAARAASGAYSDLVDSDFQKYMNGYQGHTAAEWGDALYKKLIGDDHFPSLCLDVLSGDRARFNSYCMMLNLLSPEKDYVVDLNKKALFTSIMKNFDTMNSEQASTATKFLNNSLRMLILTIVQDRAGTYPTLKKEIQGAFKEAGISTALNIQAQVEQYLTTFESQVSTLIGAMVQSTKTPLTQRMKQLSDKVNSLEADDPDHTKTFKMLAHMVALSTVAYAYNNILDAFLNLQTLPWEQRMDSITTFVFQSQQVNLKMIDLIDIFRTSTSSTDMVNAMEAFVDSLQTDQNGEAVSEFCNRLALDLDLSLQNVRQPGLGRIGQIALADVSQVARFTHLTNWSTELCRQLNLVALGTASIALGTQISRDYLMGQPVAMIVFDILQNLGFVIQSSAQSAGVSLESMSLPILGTLMVLSNLFVLRLSTIFEGMSPAHNETATKFIESDGKQLLSRLNVAPQDWLEKYHEYHPLP